MSVGACPWHGCWEIDSGPLKNQYKVLSPEPFPQPQQALWESIWYLPGQDRPRYARSVPQDPASILAVQKISVFPHED